MSTFAPATDRVVNTSWGSSRQGAAVVGLWLHHQADGAGADANDYMIGPNDRDSHPTYAIDDNDAATVVGIVHPDKAPSSTFYVNDQSAVAIEAANTTGEPEWRVPVAALEKIALIVAHHAIESPRAAYPIEANQPGVAQKGFWVGWHSQVRSTACPGPYLTARIPEIVARANQIKDAIQAGASWSDVANIPATPDTKEDALMALTDQEATELKNDVAAIKRIVRFRLLRNKQTGATYVVNPIAGTYWHIPDPTAFQILETLEVIPSRKHIEEMDNQNLAYVLKIYRDITPIELDA